MAVREDTGGTSVLGTAGLKSLLQSLILRERERLDCVLETAPAISGRKKIKKQERRGKQRDQAFQAQLSEPSNYSQALDFARKEGNLSSGKAALAS